MPVRTFNSNEIAKLKQLMNEGIQVTGEVETLREGLRDTVKAIAEEMDMKPAVLNKAIKIAYKNSLSEERDAFDDIEMILDTIKRGSLGNKEEQYVGVMVSDADVKISNQEVKGYV